MTILQVPSLILPTGWSLGTGLTTDVELTSDILEHTSAEFNADYLQEKQVQVFAQEVVTAAAPGNLWIWVELSPYLSATSAIFWAAIGGGGGAIVPTAPVILVPTGVNGTNHTTLVAWTMHSAFARIVVQMPVAGAGGAAIDMWAVQVLITGKGA